MNEIVGIFIAIILVIILMVCIIFVSLNLRVPGEGKGAKDMITGHKSSGLIVYKPQKMKSPE